MSKEVRYSFDIVFERYERVSPVLQDVQSLVVSGEVLVKKKTKSGKPYIDKRAKLDGRFSYHAGSHSYPILIPLNGTVTIRVENFDRLPILELSSPEYKKHIKLIIHGT